ncbi:hypothetical protein FA15DRAFT_672455 [Coprinopsis marcescibilis]|uniref:Uncharacterized protein n=1 Tax=Coprinopsis marcescibilis TaxID=230819 RepID=A0A5C3KMV8_COPMA|nr:hypothetical protein FA15DRAFT_672455 [Coprinopsis marcescibilis]
MGKVEPRGSGIFVYARQSPKHGYRYDEKRFTGPILPVFEPILDLAGCSEAR